MIGTRKWRFEARAAIARGGHFRRPCILSDRIEGERRGLDWQNVIGQGIGLHVVFRTKTDSRRGPCVLLSGGQPPAGRKTTVDGAGVIGPEGRAHNVGNFCCRYDAHFESSE